MNPLSDIPVRVESSEKSDPNLSIVETVLNEVRVAIERLMHSGQRSVIDVRALPRMRAATYQALKEALSSGEVTAVVEAAVTVEVRETQYPGVWWLTHRNEQGAIVTELIEVTEIPEILKPHVAEIRAGLQRLEQALAVTATSEEPPAT